MLCFNTRTVPSAFIDSNKLLVLDSSQEEESASESSCSSTVASINYDASADDDPDVSDISDSSDSVDTVFEFQSPFITSPSDMASNDTLSYRNKTELVDLALHRAAACGKETLLQELLKSNFVDTRSSRYETPLHWAMFFKQFATAKLLLEHKADLFAATYKGVKPYQLLKNSTSEVTQKLKRLVIDTIDTRSRSQKGLHRDIDRLLFESTLDYDLPMIEACFEKGACPYYGIIALSESSIASQNCRNLKGNSAVKKLLLDAVNNLIATVKDDTLMRNSLVLLLFCVADLEVYRQISSLSGEERGNTVTFEELWLVLINREVNYQWLLAWMKTFWQQEYIHRCLRGRFLEFYLRIRKFYEDRIALEKSIENAMANITSHRNRGHDSESSSSSSSSQECTITHVLSVEEDTID